MKPADERLLRNTLTANLSEDEHQLFVLACDRSELDPFARQIYFMRENGKLTIQATIDGLRLSAERTGTYAGQLGPEWCGSDGVWKEIWVEKTPPTAARVGIRRADFADPIWGKALFSEFAQDSDFWQHMPEELRPAVQNIIGKQVSGTPSGITLVSSEPASHMRDIPDRWDRHQSASIPASLQPFIVGGAIPYKQQTAGFDFIRAELQDKLGHEEGTAIFNRIRFRLPRTFPTREACHAATLRAWLEMWSFVEQGREAA